MSMSVPGNSCRTTRCCVSSPTTGCTIRLPGECVYYSASNLIGPSINTGDTFNNVVNKLTNYISSGSFTANSVIPFISADFEVDGVTIIDTNLNGRTYELFLNDLNRFIYNEIGNQEWDYITGGGFTILLPGFDANTNNYHLYLFPKT